MFGEKIVHYKYNYAVTDASDKRKYDPPRNRDVRKTD